MDRKAVRSELLFAISILLTAIARNGLTEKSRLELLESWLCEIADCLDPDEEERIRRVVKAALRELRTAKTEETFRDIVERVWGE